MRDPIHTNLPCQMTDLNTPSFSANSLAQIQIIEDMGAKAAAGLDADSLSGRTVLVTGASGLIGTGLIAALCHLQKSTPFSILAQILSEPPPCLKHWSEEGRVTIFREDLSDYQRWSALPRADCIFHAAGYGQPAKFMAQPEIPLLLNTGATHALLQRLNSAGTFVFFSSSEVLQGTEQNVFQEEDIGRTAPDHPRACYIEGKRGGEALCHIAKKNGVRAIIIRLGHIYGPGTRPNDRRVMSNFIEKALQQGAIRMQDDGAAIRTWGYVGDAVEMSLTIMLKGREVIYNVGGHDRCSILELAREIGKLCGVEVLLPECSETLAGAPLSIELDLSRSEQEFGKHSYVRLGEGLASSVSYQSKFYQ